MGLSLLEVALQNLKMQIWRDVLWFLPNQACQVESGLGSLTFLQEKLMKLPEEQFIPYQMFESGRDLKYHLVSANAEKSMYAHK